MDQDRARDLYERYKSKVFHLCLRIGGGDEAWAEDATHDVFLKVFDNLENLGSETDPGGWVYRVTVNACRDKLRRDGRIWNRILTRLRTQADLQRRPTDPHERYGRIEDARLIARAMEDLKPLERLVFSMHYLDEQEQHQICKQLSLSKGYVSKVLKRARAKVEANARTS